MNSNVSIARQDFEQAVDYLAGLELILKHLSTEPGGPGSDGPLQSDLDQLAIGEESIIFDRFTWAPMRYQSGVGQGYTFVAENVRALRLKLLDRADGPI